MRAEWQGETRARPAQPSEAEPLSEDRSAITVECALCATLAAFLEGAGVVLRQADYDRVMVALLTSSDPETERASQGEWLVMALE